MRRSRISLEKAMKLESESLLTLYFPSTSHNDLPDIPYIGKYTQNFIDAAGKYRKVDISKLLTYIDPEYQIEVPVLSDPEEGFFEWAYLYGKSKKTQEIHDQALEKGQYVYVLVNPTYDFVKIGKAVNPQSRVKQINGAGTVSEWKLYFFDVRVRGGAVRAGTKRPTETATQTRELEPEPEPQRSVITSTANHHPPE